MPLKTPKCMLSVAETIVNERIANKLSVIKQSLIFCLTALCTSYSRLSQLLRYIPAKGTSHGFNTHSVSNDSVHMYYTRHRTD